MAVQTPASGYRAVSSGFSARAVATATAVASIALAAAALTVWAPDMVTGSAHEHLQIAALVGWPMAILAIAMVLLAAAVSGRSVTDVGGWSVFAVVVGAMWVGVAVTGVFASVMSTGTDPTLIPIAAIVGPVFAVVGTAFASIYVAGGRA